MATLLDLSRGYFQVVLSISLLLGFFQMAGFTTEAEGYKNQGTSLENICLFLLTVIFWLRQTNYGKCSLHLKKLSQVLSKRLHY